MVNPYGFLSAKPGLTQKDGYFLDRTGGPARERVLFWPTAGGPGYVLTREEALGMGRPLSRVLHWVAGGMGILATFLLRLLDVDMSRELGGVISLGALLALGLLVVVLLDALVRPPLMAWLRGSHWHARLGDHASLPGPRPPAKSLKASETMGATRAVMSFALLVLVALWGVNWGLTGADLLPADRAVILLVGLSLALLATHGLRLQWTGATLEEVGETRVQGGVPVTDPASARSHGPVPGPVSGKTRQAIPAGVTRAADALRELEERQRGATTAPVQRVARGAMGHQRNQGFGRRGRA